MSFKKGNLPKIETERSSIDQIFLIGTVTLYAAAIVSLSFIYGDLPDVVPSHVNASGEVDRNGAKTWLWVFMVIGVIMAIPLYLIESIPHKYNYMVEITEQNAYDQYCIAISMMRYLNFTIAFLWLVILIALINGAKHGSSGSLMFWIFGLFVLQMVGMIYFLKKSRDYK